MTHKIFVLSINLICLIMITALCYTEASTDQQTVLPPFIDESSQKV